MKFRNVAVSIAGVMLISGGAHAGTVVTINGTDDLYNSVAPGTLDGTNPSSVSVSGLSSITFSNATGQVVLNITSGYNINDPDGVGSAPSSSSNSGANGIAGLTAPNAGYITGVFVGSTLGPAPTGLDFSGTNFTSLSPALQQAFFIGDGLTGDGAGTTQTFNVPTGATTLYLGISDACGYNGSPSCYSDNGGSFTITVNDVASGTPEPSSWALMVAGIGSVGFSLRRVRKAVVSQPKAIAA
jgi:hypothetical protein